MTCHDVREQLSALLDDALDPTEPTERAALETHLAACPDCRRELETLRATVALLGRLPAAHAPAGFVDRVVAAVYRPPWPRRILDALFVPLRVKLPLEAVAVLLVSVSALYVYQRTPEVRELARQETRETPPAPSPVVPAPTPSTATPPGSAAPEIAAKTPAPKDRAAELERAPAQPPAVREGTGQAPPAAGPPMPSTPIPDLRAAPMTPPPTEFQQESKAKKETQGPRGEERSDALGGKASAPGAERVAKSSPSSASRDAAEEGAQGPPPGPLAGAASKPPSPRPRGVEGGASPGAPPAPPRAGAAGEAPAAAKANVAPRLMRAVDASGRLVVPAREPAETALDALLGRLGGRRVERRLEGDRGLVVIDVLVPGARYRELVDGLGQIGRWVTEHEPATLPAQLRVEVALTVEP